MTTATMAHGAHEAHNLPIVETENPGPAPKRIVTGYGFWIFILSDMVMFSAFFAAYAVLSGQTAGGPHGSELFNLKNVAIETGCLLLSSFTCGMSAVACGVRSQMWTQLSLLVTGLLGVAFLVLEANDFAELVREGAGPQRSAFLSSFFTLVGTHGLHVTFGLVWLVTLLVQLGRHGLTTANQRRLQCLSMFWHFLDVVWIGVFTFVYLMGVLP